jgi:DNA-directed DNA polymerase III PolC
MFRTGYSFRVAYGHLEDVADRIKEIGWTTAPICDRNNTFAFNRWTSTAHSKGLRCIYGVELGVTPDVTAEKPVIDYWRFLALEDLTPLHDLIWLATSQSHVWPLGGHEPLLTYDQAIASKGVGKITGSRLLLGHLRDKSNLTINAHEQLDNNVKDLDVVKNQKGFWDNHFPLIGMSPSLPKALYKAAKEEGLEFCAVSDNVYPALSHKSAYQVAMGKRSQTQIYPQHILDDEELRKACYYVSDEDFAQAVANRERLLGCCTAQMKKGSILVPEKPKTLRQMCEEGAKAKGCDLTDPVYKERLEKELKLIEEKNFGDYFHVVSDFMQWAKRRMVVGPGRGSSSGSLVCYLLDITVADPVKFDLVFERFIDITRADYPDIDVDLSDDRRELVFQYLEERYGKDRVARLGTVAVFQSKSALKQAAMAIGVPQWMVDAAANSVITRSKGDSRADYKVADTFTMTDAGKRLADQYPDMKIAGEIESHPQFRGQHAAGIILTDKPVRDYVGVDAHNKIAMVDWVDAKDLDLLKVDILGLTQLSIFERCLRMIGQKDISGFLETLPLDDTAAFDIVNKRHLAGIFQFQGGTTNQVVHQINRIDHIEDFVSITALCRPGPLGSGGTQSWINRKNGTEKVTTFHEAFAPYLEKTFGIMVYQEQVMRICREIGGMSWGDVTALRKAMGKSMGMEYFNSYRDKYLPNALAKGIPEEAALKMWDGMCSFGMYAFNRAHALAYGLVSYYCCWLKAHHPLEFAAATLDAENEPGKQIAILRELREEGIDYVAIDLETSIDTWTVRKEGNKSFVVGPLTLIHGIGPAAVEKIMEARANGTMESLGASIKEKLTNPQTAIDSLYPIADAVKKLWPDIKAKPFPHILTRPTPVNQVFETRAGKDVLIIGVLVRNHPLDENEPGRVAGRGYAVKGATAALNLHLRDDTGDIFCKVNRFDYPKLAPPLVNGKVKESIYAIKGSVPKDFRMVWVSGVRYLGEIDGITQRLDQMAQGASRGDGRDSVERRPRHEPASDGQVAASGG